MNTTTSATPCMFFARGECMYGSKCRFSHDFVPSAAGAAAATAAEDGSPSSAISLPICKYFSAGNCRFGDRCFYSHSTPLGGEAEQEKSAIAEDESVTKAPARAKAEEEEEEECGICLEKVTRRARYGLLENCDHVFCVKCIHQWRLKGRSAAEGSVQQENWRKCPICRRDSEVVWPSKYLLKGSEREDYIATETFEKSITPCRDFKPSQLGGGGGRGGGCKRGWRCLYQHLDANGKDAKPRQKREEEAHGRRRERRDRDPFRRRIRSIIARMEDGPDDEQMEMVLMEYLLSDSLWW